MNQHRRLVVKGLTVLLPCTYISLASKQVHSKWPASLFDSENLSEVITGLFNSKVAMSGDILIKAPDIAERGDKVPISISTNIPNAKSIIILVDKNPRPLMSKFFIVEGSEAYVSIHIKMRESSNLIAFVETDNKLFKMEKKITVTTGGC